MPTLDNQYVHVLKKIDALEHESAVVSSKKRQFVVTVIGNVLAAEEHFSKCGLVHSRKCVQKCGFARTRSSHDDGEIAFHDREIHVLYYVLHVAFI